MSEIWYRRALDAHKRGDHAATLRACEEASPDPESQLLAHTVRASTLANLGRPDRALSEIRAAVRLGGRSVELFRLGARILADRGQLDAALRWADRALALRPASLRTLELREHVVSRMHLLSGLFEQLELAVELHPEHAEAREKLVRMCLELRLFSMAEPHLEVLIAQNPERTQPHLDLARVTIETGRAELATRALDRALSLRVDLPERVRIAQLFVKAGALERALLVDRENQKLAPEASEARLQSGFFALWQGDVRGAKAACMSLPEQTPGLARLGAAIAFVEERYEASLAMATEASNQDQRDAEALALRAAALLGLERFAEAEQCAQNADRVSAEFLPAALLVRVAVRASRFPIISRFDTAEVFELLAPLWPAAVIPAREAIDLDSTAVGEAMRVGLRQLSGNFTSVLTFVPEGTTTWSSFAPKPPARMACVRTFDFIQARPFAWVAERIRALSAVYPGSPYVHTHAAELFLWHGDYAACEAECRKALALSKTEGTRWAWVGLGAALMLQERHAAALEVFAESNDLLPAGDRPRAPLLAYRGETLRRLGDLDAAREDLTRSLSLVPSRLSAWINLALIASQQNRPDEARAIYDRVNAQLPSLLRDVERDRPASDDAKITATFEHALQVMRGNRSSNRITYFLKDGRARVLSARPLT